MGNLGNNSRNGHCLSVLGVGVNDFALFGTGRLFGHYFFDVGYIRILTDLHMTSVAGDGQSKACSVLIGNKLPIFIMSESGDFFDYFRVAHRAVTFLFAFHRAGRLFRHFKCFGSVYVASVSIYKYHFAALLADVVALAVGAAVCAGRFLALEFNYAFNRGVVSALLVAVGVICCGIAVERMRLFGDCFLYGQLDTVFDVGVNNQSLLRAGCGSALFFDACQTFFCRHVRTVSRTGSYQSEGVVGLLHKLICVAVSESGNVSFDLRIANRAMTDLFAGSFASRFLAHLVAPLFNRVLFVSHNINHFAALLAHIVALAVLGAGCVVVGELFYARYVNAVSAFARVQPFGLFFAVERMLGACNRDLKREALSVYFKGIRTLAFVRAEFLLLRHCIGIELFTFVRIECGQSLFLLRAAVFAGACQLACVLRSGSCANRPIFAAVTDSCGYSRINKVAARAYSDVHTAVLANGASLFHNVVLVAPIVSERLFDVRLVGSVTANRAGFARVALCRAGRRHNLYIAVFMAGGMLNHGVSAISAYAQIGAFLVARVLLEYEILNVFVAALRSVCGYGYLLRGVVRICNDKLGAVGAELDL